MEYADTISHVRTWGQLGIVLLGVCLAMLPAARMFQRESGRQVVYLLLLSLLALVFGLHHDGFFWGRHWLGIFAFTFGAFCIGYAAAGGMRGKRVQ